MGLDYGTLVGNPDFGTLNGHPDFRDMGGHIYVNGSKFRAFKF